MAIASALGEMHDSARYRVGCSASEAAVGGSAWQLSGGVEGPAWRRSRRFRAGRLVAAQTLERSRKARLHDLTLEPLVGKLRALS
jgi:hypothetical protein